MRENVADSIMDINLILFIIVIVSRGTICVIPALIFSIISLFMFIMFGGIR